MKRMQSRFTARALALSAALSTQLIPQFTDLTTAQAKVVETPVLQKETGEQEALKFDVTKEKLPNGLTLIMNPDHRVPTVAVEVRYLVGSGHEREGRSGFAHLFDHLMFQGSEKI